MKKNSRHQTAARQRQSVESATGHAVSHFTPVKIGITLGILLLGGTAVVTLVKAPPSSPSAAAPPTAVSDEMMARALTAGPPSTASNPGDGGLPPPAPGTKAPINATDPFTGKSINASSPTVEYKGYVIAFCCKDSSGYKGGWQRMSESDKDAVVRRFIK